MLICVTGIFKKCATRPNVILLTLLKLKKSYYFLWPGLNVWQLTQNAKVEFERERNDHFPLDSFRGIYFNYYQFN